MPSAIHNEGIFYRRSRGFAVPFVTRLFDKFVSVQHCVSMKTGTRPSEAREPTVACGGSYWGKNWDAGIFRYGWIQSDSGFWLL